MTLLALPSSFAKARRFLDAQCCSASGTNFNDDRLDGRLNRACNGFMKSLRVSLDAADTRKADALRKGGIQISTLVRNAIRDAYARRRKPTRRLKTPSKIIEEIHQRYPTPPDAEPRGYDVHDAKQARAAIIAKLKRKRTSI